MPKGCSAPSFLESTELMKVPVPAQSALVSHCDSTGHIILFKRLSDVGVSNVPHKPNNVAPCTEATI